MSDNATSAADPRSTSDRGLSLTGTPVETFASVFDVSKGEFAPCANATLTDREADVAGLPMGPENLPPDQQYVLYDERSLVLISQYSIFGAVEQSTSCLFRLLALIDGTLTLYTHMKYPRHFITLAERALGIADQIEARTRAPFSAKFREHPPLNKAILGLPPMGRRAEWQRFANLRNGRSRSAVETVQAEPEISAKDKARFEAEADALALEISSSIEAAKVDLDVHGAPMKVFHRYMGWLKSTKFGDAERGTHARFNTKHRDRSVAPHIRMVFWNSVYTVLLTRTGQPIQVPGLAPYGILVPEPGDNFLRRIQPPGLYVSLGQLASYQLRIPAPRKVQTLVFGGIFGLQREVFGFTREELGTEASKHDFQRRLHGFLTAPKHPYALASIVVTEAFEGRDLTFRGLKRAVEDLIPLMVADVYDEIVKRLKRLPDELAERVAELAKEVILEATREIIKDWAIEWLIKKVGKKVIPGVNVVSAAMDAISGPSDLVRTVLACLIMAIRSGTPDDMAITSKVLSKVAVDEVGNKIVSRIVSEAGGRLSKAARARLTPSGPDLSEPTYDPLPAETVPEPAHPTPQPKPPNNVGAPDTSGTGPMQHPARQAAPASARSTDDRGTAEKGTSQPAPAKSKQPAPSDAKASASKTAAGDNAEAVHQTGLNPRSPHPKKLGPPAASADSGGGNGRPAQAQGDGTGGRSPPSQPPGGGAGDSDPPDGRDPGAVPPKKQKDGETPAAQDRDPSETDAEARGTDERPELHPDDIDPGTDEARRMHDISEVYDQATESTGAGRKAREIDARDIEEMDGIGERPRAGGKEPKGVLHGQLGETEERLAAGVPGKAIDYRKQFSPATKREHRDTVVAGYKDNPGALEAMVIGLDMPEGGLDQVAIPAPHGKGKTRIYDRVDYDDKGVLLVESKRNKNSTLNLDRGLRQQLDNDEAVLGSFKRVRIEYFLQGKVSKPARERINELQKRFPGRVNIRQPNNPNPDKR